MIRIMPDPLMLFSSFASYLGEFRTILTFHFGKTKPCLEKGNTLIWLKARMIQFRLNRLASIEIHRTLEKSFGVFTAELKRSQPQPNVLNLPAAALFNLRILKTCFCWNLRRLYRRLNFLFQLECLK